MLFSERMTPFQRLKGNIPAGCPDIQAPALSSTFNEVNAVFLYFGDKFYKIFLKVSGNSFRSTFIRTNA